MPYLLIANADAGTSERIDDAAAVLDEADGCRVVWSEGPSDIDQALDDDGSSTPVVAGGDGSIHLFVGRLAAHGLLRRTVGILPMGTGNDLARGLGLPFDPAEAARAILQGTAVELPLMSTPGGELGVNNAHTGVGVAAARRGAEWKDHMGGFAYTAGSIAEGIAYDGFEATVTIDGTTAHQGPCLAIMVLIGPSAGGGFQPLPDVDVSDPVLDVLVVGDGDTPDRVALAISALRGQLSDSDAVRRWRAATVEVGAGDEEWELDGEFRRWEDPVRLSLSEHTWSVLA